MDQSQVNSRRPGLNENVVRRNFAGSGLRLHQQHHSPTACTREQQPRRQPAAGDQDDPLDATTGTLSRCEDTRVPLLALPAATRVAARA